MKKFLVYSGLILMFGFTISAEDIFVWDIFTLQTGTVPGSCDSHKNVLDAWHQESIDGLDTAIAILQEYNDEKMSDSDSEIAENALKQYFGISKTDTGAKKLIGDVQVAMQHVLDFFNGKKLGLPKKLQYLFCNSDYLVQYDASTEPALDEHCGEIFVDGNPITINQVDAYATYLRDGAVPWWAGEHTNMCGFYFTAPDSGGKYCAKKGQWGETSALTFLLPNPDFTQPQVKDEVNNVVICPASFERKDIPESYRDGSDLIKSKEGLKKWVPRSATLLHEAFHVVHGSNFLAGEEEVYDPIPCTSLASKNPEKARLNPESYVSFVATMHYRFGEVSDPDGLKKNWNFVGGRAKEVE